MPNADVARLFVYGSLKRGFSNEHQMKGATFLRTCATQSGFRLVRYLGGYPALVAVPGDAGHVDGELYDVEELLLAALDEFEGCPQVYQRNQILMNEGSWAAAYLVSPTQARGFPLLEGSVWREA